MPDVDKLVAACPSDGWKLLIALCRLAGLRRGEALALTWAAVDLRERRLRVMATKTGRRRLVPIEPKLYAMLREAHEHVEDQAQRVADVNPHCVWRNFTVIRKKAALPEWDDAFQVMRRNCETDWAQRYPQYAVSTWIGHDITVSAQHYLQVPEELYRKVSRGSPAAA